VTALTITNQPELRRLPVPVAEPRPALRIVPDRPPQTEPSTDPEPLLTDGHVPSPPGSRSADPRRRTPPPAAAWARQFVQAALEAATGRRPVSQLVRWTDDEVLALISRRAALAARLDRTGTPASGGCLVRSVRLCHLSPSVVEASAVVIDHGRCRAVAVRLEDTAGRWRVTALEIG
jgi:hypothetical protein